MRLCVDFTRRAVLFGLLRTLRSDYKLVEFKLTPDVRNGPDKLEVSNAGVESLPLSDSG